MKVVVFLVVYLIVCTVFGIIACSNLDAEFIKIYLLAVAVGAIGGVYTAAHHLENDYE